MQTPPEKDIIFLLTEGGFFMAEITMKTEDNRNDAYSVRMAVFVAEQGYQNEFDDIDNVARFATIYCDGKCVGTGRIFPDPKGEAGTWQVGRIAVLKEYRKHHLGAAVLTALEVIAKSEHAKKIKLLAQESAVGFYEKCGYGTSDAPVAYDEGHPHHWMEKAI